MAFFDVENQCFSDPGELWRLPLSLPGDGGIFNEWLQPEFSIELDGRNADDSACIPVLELLGETNSHKSSDAAIGDVRSVAKN